MNEKECENIPDFVISPIPFTVRSHTQELGAALVIKHRAMRKTSSGLAFPGLKVESLKMLFPYWLAFQGNTLTVVLTFSRQIP